MPIPIVSALLRWDTDDIFTYVHFILFWKRLNVPRVHALLKKKPVLVFMAVVPMLHITGSVSHRFY